MKTKRRPPHRPRGQSSRQILLFKRTDNPGYYLHIGLALDELLGRPAAIRIERRSGGWSLHVAEPDTEGSHRVLRVRNNTPRTMIGLAEYEELGLTLGHYNVIILDGIAHF